MVHKDDVTNLDDNTDIRTFPCGIAMGSDNDLSSDDVQFVPPMEGTTDLWPLSVAQLFITGSLSISGITHIAATRAQDALPMLGFPNLILKLALSKSATAQMET